MADRGLQKKLRLLIDTPKKEGKKAHFAGTRMIIDGKKDHPLAAILSEQSVDPMSAEMDISDLPD